MATIIVTPDQDAIVSEIEIAAPPERIFKALSDARELTRWFGTPECPVKSWQMEARVGGRYSYSTVKGSIVVNGVSEFECHGEILECDPPRVLALYLDRELARRHGAAHCRAMGTHTETRRNIRQSYAQRSCFNASRSQGLFRRMA